MHKLSDSKLDIRGKRDTVFAESKNFATPFEFTKNVSEAFDDMALRSIPLYENLHVVLLEWAKRAPIDRVSRIYDIGCATGTGVNYLARYLETPCQFIGLDTSAHMVALAREKTSLLENHKFTFLCQNASRYSFESCSFVVMNYTLQFLPRDLREGLLRKIYEALTPGGILFLSEKLRFDCPIIQQQIDEIYFTHKRSKNYSECEIQQKKKSLENFLVPITEEEQKSMLKSAGFDFQQVVLKWHQFTSFVAIKR